MRPQDLATLAHAACYELSDAIEILESLRSKVQSSMELQAFMQQEKARTYAAMVEMQLALNQPEAALDWAERGKARAFIDLMGAKTPTTPRTEVANRLKQQDQLEREMGELQGHLALLPAEGERGAAVRDSQQLADRTRRYGALLEEMAASSPEVAATRVTRPQSFAEIRSSLPPDLLVIEYFATGAPDTALSAWAISAQGLVCHPITVKPQELRDRVQAFRSFIAQPDAPYPAELSQQLYQELLQPFAAQLDQAKLVCIVPHGILHYLPFHALRAGDKYLIERWPMIYAPSLNALWLCRRHNPSAQGSMIVFANPQAPAGLPSLPFADQEARDISAESAHAQVLSGGQATETAAKQQSGGKDIIHFATHGELNPYAPLLSCLYLTPDQDNDGRLEVHEIFDLRLNASLVTLSACQTALGAVSDGDDMVGLSRAFMYAGTPTVLASLWRVPDQSTAALMADFYGALTKTDKARALQQAQCRALHAGKSPYQWAAFQIIGDWQ